MYSKIAEKKVSVGDNKIDGERLSILNPIHIEIAIQLKQITEIQKGMKNKAYN